MANRAGRVREWIGRYLIAELTGLTAALIAALVVMSWSADRLVLIAYASALGEGVGFYAGFLVVRYLREDIAGSPRHRLAVIAAAAVVEFGPAEIVDTVLVRPAAMYLGSLATGNVIAGVLIGKVAADLVFYGLAITSYEVLVRRLLRRFRRPVAPTAPGAPELIMDLAVVSQHYRDLSAALPGVRIHFAAKCNPDPGLLRHLHGLGSAFEVASAPELQALLALGVGPDEVIFSNPVKPWWHVSAAHAAGVEHFAADSEPELIKLAEHAPGCAVMIRLSTAPAAGDTSSEVPSEGKFGVAADEAVRLLITAAGLGLRPWGLTFHVGSQMIDPRAWIAPIRQAAMIMEALLPSGIRLVALDIGGGFPADYGRPHPPIEDYGTVIMTALAALPYEVAVLAEPGRGLAADAGRLTATVIGTAERGGRHWAHLDVGAFNGVMEALETNRQLVLPMTDDRGGPTRDWVVTGPSCDSQDTLHDSVPLSAGLHIGDRVTLHTAGAYTTAYASTFNGFPVPTIRYQPSELRSSGTSTANLCSTSRPTTSRTRPLVAASTTGAARPAS